MMTVLKTTLWRPCFTVVSTFVTGVTGCIWNSSHAACPWSGGGGKDGVVGKAGVGSVALEMASWVLGGSAVMGSQTIAQKKMCAML